MDEIIEGTVGSLHILARDHQNRHIIRSHHCIPLIVQVRSQFPVLSPSPSCFNSVIVCVSLSEFVILLCICSFSVLVQSCG